MKPILVDELFTDTSQKEFKIIVNNVPVRGYSIDKPIIYQKRYISLGDRILMAWGVLLGRAIGVYYFEDLKQSEKEEYVKRRLNR